MGAGVGASGNSLCPHLGEVGLPPRMVAAENSIAHLSAECIKGKYSN